MPSRYTRTKEGFQTTGLADSSTTKALVQNCPEAAIRSFPVQLGITPTDTLYDSVSEPITMDIQWSTRSTPPAFRTKEATDGILDEVGAGNTNLTTLIFRNNKYVVESVQLAEASHKTWILPTSSQEKNTTDLVITFTTSSDLIQYRYLVFVIPLLEQSSASTPTYLSAIATPESNGPFSLRDVFPEDTRALFAYYSTCLKGYVDQKTPENVYIFVAVNGVEVAGEIMTAIKAKGGYRTFPKFIPPFVNRLESGSRVISSNFSTYVQTTNQLLNFERVREIYKDITKAVREDSLDAYKCVPFDPDSTVEDGKLKIDLDSGEPLPTVIEERAAIRKADKLESNVEKGRLEKYLGSAIGILIGVVVFGAILFFGISWFLGGTPATVVDDKGLAPATPATPVPQWVQNIPQYGLIALVTAFLGFIIGVTLA